MDLVGLVHLRGLLEATNLLVSLVAVLFALYALCHVDLSLQKRSWLVLSLSAIFFSAAELVGVARELWALSVPGLYEALEFGFVLTFAVGFFYLLLSERFEISGLKLRSVTDGLTSLYNHAFFERGLAERVATLQETRPDLSLLFIDIDEFKAYNDLFGHDAGNAVLRKVAHVILRQSRATDLVARYGGEEFTVVVNADPVVASKIAERIRMAVEATCCPKRDASIKRPITVSIGCATLGRDGATATDLLQAADAYMYAAKHAGRNRVRTVAENQPNEAKPRTA